MMTHSALKAASDDTLSAEFVYWFRVYRIESRLDDEERDYFRRLSAEMRRRGLLTT